MEFPIDPEHAGQRLDRELARRFPEFSRARLQTLIKEGTVTVNGRTVKPGAELKPGDVVSVLLPDPGPESPPPPAAEALPLDILFEDEALLVIHKASGMAVHPGPGTESGTVVNALLHHCGPSLSSIGGAERPGIVHRLDKGTSGCLVIAKTDAAHTSLAAQFADRHTSKWYLAIVRGRPTADSGRIVNELGRHPVDRKRRAVLAPGTGKAADTEWWRGPTREDATLILCRLHTGRTHQIRVHMKESLRCPILGDELYGRADASRLMLHAWRLAFTHPGTGAPWHGEAKPPAEFDPWLADFDPDSLLSTDHAVQ